ncbi:MAG: xanthine dehydrogenase family protein [Treponema sp.]|nr:xanthine dehydrogenase family protein [Treponema sp.]
MPRKLTEKPQIRSFAANGYYSDLSKPDMLYAQLIRSPAAAGKFKDITYDVLPENCYLFTAKDIPGSKELVTNSTKTKIFGYGNVSYTGEPLGILIGPDKRILDSTADELSINFDVESLESALKNVIVKNKHPVITLQEQQNPELNDVLDLINNMPSLDTVIDRTHVDEKLSKNIAVREVKSGIYKTMAVLQADKQLSEDSAFKTENNWSQKLVNPKWHESDGAFCYTEGEKLHVYCPTKWVYQLQKTLADMLKIKEELIHIHRTKSTGIYPNGLYKTNQLALQAALASYLTKKPVKLILSTQEQEQFMASGVETKFNYKAFINDDGKIKGLHIEIDIDIGAENPFAQEITDRITLAACNYYKCENLYINTVAHTSKNPPTTINLKTVDSQSLFAMENEIQSISKVTNIDPDEIRLINAVSQKKSDFPFIIENPNFEECIKNTLKISDFKRKYAAFHMDAIDRVEKDSRPFFALPLRGIGFACAFNSTGYSGSLNFTYDTKVEVTLTTDNKLIIHTNRPSEIIQEIWKKTAADILQFPKQNIHINSDYELSQLPKTPADSYSTIGVINELIKRCCNDIKKKRFQQALPITAKRNISSAMARNWNKEDFSGNPFYSTATAATAVEVELDSYSFNEKIKGIWVTIDSGVLYDENAALKTVKLEIQQELSMLVEGKTFSCNNININFIQNNNKSGQVGQLIHNTLPAAFSTALSLALATQLEKLPVTEKQIYTLIKNRGEK